MATEKTKLTVGLFVAGGIVTALSVFIWLGVSRFLEKGDFYVTYFNESIQGLDKDSPVKYRGVSIGRVDRFRVSPDSRLIEVILKIESGQKLDRGIVAQLKSIGLTGSMFIELDRKRWGEPERSPHLSFPSEYPIVSSKPSHVSDLIKGFDDVLEQVRAMDLEGISEKVKSTLDHMNRVIDEADVGNLSNKVGSSMDKANKSLTGVDKTLARVGKVVADNEKTIKKTLEELKLAMENTNKLLKEGSSLVTGTDKSLDNFTRRQTVVAQNLERASGNLNRLIDILARQPSQLIFGQPPVPRNIEPAGSQR
jgi:phospholipid/cholesterol/gamma-HCH transport system substrate-binding protein